MEFSFASWFDDSDFCGTLKQEGPPLRGGHCLYYTSGPETATAVLALACENYGLGVCMYLALAACT